MRIYSSECRRAARRDLLERRRAAGSGQVGAGACHVFGVVSGAYREQPPVVARLRQRPERSGEACHFRSQNVAKMRPAGPQAVETVARRTHA